MKPELLNVRGQLNMLVLAVLDSGPQPTYAVREAILRRSGRYFDLSASAVNAVLRRVEHLGLVASSWSVIDGHTQRAYRLTPVGEDQLRADRAEWRQAADAVARILESRPRPADP